MIFLHYVFLLIGTSKKNKQTIGKFENLGFKLLCHLIIQSIIIIQGFNNSEDQEEYLNTENTKIKIKVL